MAVLFSKSLLLFMFILVTASSSSADPGPPSLVRPAYTTVNNILYIQGGSHDVTGSPMTSGLYSLDLTQPWNVNNPPWKSLASKSRTVAAPTSRQHTMVGTADNTSLIVWDAPHYTIATYDIQTNAWTASTNYSNSNPNWGGFQVRITASFPSA